MSSEPRSPRPRPPVRRPARRRTLAGQRRLVALGILAVAAVFGYIASMFIFPAPLVSRDTPVARVIGLSTEEAERRLEDQGFRPKAEGAETDPAVPAGHVLWQDPPAGVELPSGTEVRLTVSEGPGSVPVPDVLEFEVDQAARVLAAGGLRLGAVDSVPAAQPEGVVLSTRPSVGTTLAANSVVDLVVSRGPASIRVPNVVGLDRVEARGALEGAGLIVGTVDTQPSRRDRPGRVIAQRPAAGALVPRGSRINLTVVRPEGS